ncbi:MAG: outer membrane beta-barrel family protein, partial [Ginsengibacter sp.]
SDDEPYLDPQNGFITNINAGINYNNKWNDKHTLTFTPKYNSQDYNNHKQTFAQTQIGDSVINDNSDVASNIKRHNFKNRLTYEIKLDSNNTLKLTANANFYHTESEEIRNSISTGGTGTLKNTSNRTLQTNSDKSALSGNLLFKHKFEKARRTLSISADWNVLDTKGKNFLQSLNQAYFAGSPAGNQQLNQMKDYDFSTNNLAAKFTYTEPLSKEYSLELGYQLAYNFGNNNQVTYSYSPATGKYDFTVDSLSNQFKQSILQNIPSAKINFANKKFKINAGSGFGITNFELKDITFNKDYTRKYTNFFPTANVTYTYKPNHNVRFSYNGNTRQPTINQLQPLRNNNDYFNQYIGNPNLKPSFTNSFNLSHNSYNFIKDLYTYISLNTRVTSNSITISRIISKDSGKTVSQPINTNGNYTVGLYSGMGFKIKKIDTRISFNPNINYNRYVGVLNNNQIISKDLNAGFNVGLSKSKEKKYDISVNNEFGYTRNTSSQNNTKVHYNTNTVSVNGTLYSMKVWSLIVDYRFYSRQKTAQFSNGLNTHLLNARLQRTFKSNEFTAYVSVRDILNQNVGIQRYSSGTSYSETINDRLKRYLLIGFSWDFKNKAPKVKTEPSKN